MSWARSSLAVVLLAATARARPHCPHECPEAARTPNSGFDSCGPNSHCVECDACVFASRMKEQEVRAQAAAVEEAATARAEAAERAANALIAPSPPMPSIPERERLWLGNCLPTCRKVDQCQHYDCHACDYCEEEVIGAASPPKPLHTMRSPRCPH